MIILGIIGLLLSCVCSINNYTNFENYSQEIFEPAQYVVVDIPTNFKKGNDVFEQDQTKNALIAIGICFAATLVVFLYSFGLLVFHALRKGKNEQFNVEAELTPTYC
jgi:cbb3-type cytochrome oxidase subunit 3